MKAPLASAMRATSLVLPALALLWLATVSARWLQAEILAAEVNRQLSAWDAGFGRIELAEWKLTFADISRAQRYNPQRAEYEQLRGQVQEWRRYAPWTPAGSEPADDLDALFAIPRAARQDALAAYRSAAHARPAWPYGWVEFARAKAMADELDAEFSAAVARGAVHGRHHGIIPQALVQLLMDHQAFVLANPALNSVMLENLQVSLAQDSSAAPAVLAILRNNAALPVFCPLLDQSRLATEAREACAAQ